MPSTFGKDNMTFTAVWKEITVPEGFVFVEGDTIIGKMRPSGWADSYYGVFREGRTVTLSPFIMCDHEVTQGEYEAVMDGAQVEVDGKTYTLNKNPSCCTEENKTEYGVTFGTDYKRRPVENVTWYDAVYYCNLRSKREGLTPAYEISIKKIEDWNGGRIVDADVSLVEGADGWRLPTEAEWEYAARGGDPEEEAWDYRFSGAPSGEHVDGRDTGMDSVGWYECNNDSWHAENWSRLAVSKTDSVTKVASGKGTHEVKQLNSNALGLYDMSGNVWEWCWDWHSGTVQSGEVTDPTGATSGSDRVLRGGSWDYFANRASVCSRGYYGPGSRYSNLGFRVVRSAK